MSFSYLLIFGIIFKIAASFKSKPKLLGLKAKSNIAGHFFLPL